MRPAAFALVPLLLLTTAAAHAQPDWREFNLDAQHTGVQTGEIAIHPGNVSTLHAATGFPVTLPAVADGAPVFLSGVSTPTGTKDLLFLTTKDGRILALDAANGSTVWSHQPATTPRYTTSSPAVDPGRQFVYSYGLAGKVHKYQVGDGTETTTGGWPQIATLKPDVEKCSPALAIATVADGTTYLYAANGGYPGDAGDYQGHITAINLATGAQHVFNANCSDQADVHFVENGVPPMDCVHVQTAIWARSAVVYDASLDTIFMSTGNGEYDVALPTGHEWGDSVFSLHPDGTGTGVNGNPIDSYTPAEFATLNAQDLDLGSTAPAILPVPAGSAVAHLGVQSGKDAQVRLLNLANLSGLGGPRHTGGELQKLALPQGGQVLTAVLPWRNPADGSSWAFIANNSGISGLKLALDGSGNPSLASQWSHNTSGTGGTSPILVNGMLFYASFGGVRALDPVSGTQLWSAAFGGLHWESPIVVNGRLYVTDENARLWAFVPNPQPLDFYALSPCRAIDTRGADAPALPAGATRTFSLTGKCAIPADARALAGNLTVIAPGSAGGVTITAAGIAPAPSTIRFPAGATVANNAVIALTGNPLGSVDVQAAIPAGSAHLVLDVVGYLK